MNPLIKRRQNDLEKLAHVEKTYSFLKILRVIGNPITEIQIQLNLKLPISETDFRNEFILTIQLPADYPLKSPIFRIKPVVWNPNIYTTGTICTGSKWIPTIPLDQELLRIIKILLFYKEYINLHSSANIDAVNWYKKHQKNFPLMML